jgi:hypothetical protein
MPIRVLIFSCAVAVLFSGCGLIAIPHSATLPPVHMRSVTVREAGSRRLLPTATVRYEGRDCTNWARLEAPLDATLVSQANDGSAAKVVLMASARGAGQFVFVPVRRTEWSHVLFPIGLPLGGVLQHYYGSSVVASAPGHSAVRVSGRLPARLHSPWAENADGLTILLPRTSP